MSKTSTATYATGEHHPSDSDDEEDALSDDEEMSKGEWSVSSESKADQPVASDDLEKPRQRVLTANRNWLIAVVALYTASTYFDALIAGDVAGYGPDEPIWIQTTFPVFFETPEVPQSYDAKGKVLESIPIPLLPVWKELMDGEIVETTGVHPNDYEMTLELKQPAVVPVIAGVVDVQQVGIMMVSIRFFKPYFWGSPSANQSLAVLLEDANNPGAKMYTRIDNPDKDERGQPGFFDTFNMNLGSPLKGRINEDSGQQEKWITLGRKDGRPPSFLWLDIFVGVQVFGMICMCITAVVLSQFAWDAQVEEYGDVRLSVKQDDPKADMYRMKWPTWTFLLAAMFRLEAVPELMECLKSKKEYWTLICVMAVGNVVQTIPSFLLQLHLAHGSGAGPSFGMVLSMMCKVGAFVGTLVLWERSNAFTANNVAVKLSWDAHCILTWQRIAVFRFAGLMSRLLPLAVLMTMYSEIVVAYVFGLDAVVIFVMMIHTGLRQRCRLGNEKCNCGNFCFFYITRLPALLFFYNDSYMGRSFDNSIIHPLLYLIARSISFGVVTYYWWSAQVRRETLGAVGVRCIALIFFYIKPFLLAWLLGLIPFVHICCLQTIVWGPLGALNETLHEERGWLLNNDTGFPNSMLVEDPLSGFPTMVASVFFFFVYLKTFVDVWKRAGKYYEIPPGRRRGLCFCWTCILDQVCRHRCGLCGGKGAIPPPPPPSKFMGQTMDAAAIELARPKQSLMLRRLRANAATKSGASVAATNKYRMRTDDEMMSVQSDQSYVSGRSRESGNVSRDSNGDSRGSGDLSIVDEEEV